MVDQASVVFMEVHDGEKAMGCDGRFHIACIKMLASEFTKFYANKKLTYTCGGVDCVKFNCGLINKLIKKISELARQVEQHF